MDVRFVAPDLRKLDLLDAEAMAVPVHTDERPLRGATGLLDWRLCGRFSQLVVRGRVTGREGERVLVPTAGRLSFDKVLLVGAGPSAGLDAAQARRTVRAMLEVLDGLRIRRAAIALPGRTWELLEAVTAMDVLAPMILEPHEQDAITVIEQADEHRAMQRALESARRKHRADAS
ncbi:MAG: M17 family peptidase N-terminal domain-containing protein [Sandaracinus sp.]